MHTAGSLNDGKMVYLQRLTSHLNFSMVMLQRITFLFSNPHEFGKTIDIRMTPIRVVCNNTLTLSLNQDSNAMLKVNHRKEFDVAEVKEQMGIAREKMEQYKTVAEFLGSKDILQRTLFSTSMKYSVRLQRKRLIT